MKTPAKFVRCLCAALLFLSAPAGAQLAAIHPGRVPVGRVLHYVKSARDGAHATEISAVKLQATRPVS